MFDIKNKKKMDLDSLDELIGKCEDSMISPFKKKKAAVAIEVAPEGEEDGEEMTEDSPSEVDFSDMDVEDLVRMYQELKESQGE